MKNHFNECTYGDLKVGDVISWYGAELEIVRLYKEVRNGLKTTYFDTKPVNEEAERLLGNLYSHGRYGGCDCCAVARLT